VEDLLDDWAKISKQQKDAGATLRYQQYDDGTGPYLLRYPLDPDLERIESKAAQFKTHRSLRDVEPACNLRLIELNGNAIGSRGGPGVMARPQWTDSPWQVINVFGPGALMDLPHHAAIVGGLDTWTGRRRPQAEDHRTPSPEQDELVLERPGLTMYEPPADSQDPDAAPSGIAVYRFPEWFTVQITMKGPQDQRTRPLVTAAISSPRRNGRGRDRKKYDIVPCALSKRVRMGIFQTSIGTPLCMAWASRGRSRAAATSSWMSGAPAEDLTEVAIRCDCGKSKQLILALEDKTALGGAAAKAMAGWQQFRPNAAIQRAADLQPLLNRSHPMPGSHRF